MESYAVSLVKLADEEANISTHDAFERLPVRRYYIYRDSSGAQRRGNFQGNKAGTNDYHTFCGTSLGNDRLAVIESTEIVELRIGRSFDLQMDGVGSGGQQESPKFERLAILKDDPPPFRIKR
jgi:hypothetical protein